MVSGSPYFQVSFFIFVLGCSVCGSLVGDPYVFYDWTVSYLTTSPLGDEQQVIGINGQFPGPILNITTNWNVVVNVKNDLDEPLLLTWNGIQHRKNSWQDGVSGTNCPIPAGWNWTDWYTKSHKGLRKDVENGVDLGVPDGILINGLGPYRYDQALVKDGIVYQIINVEPGKTYRFRGLATGPLPDPPNVYDTYFSMNQARSIRWNVSAGAARPNPQGSFKYGDITVTDVCSFLFPAGIRLRELISPAHHRFPVQVKQ
ncbi:hypothetical protein V6N13_137777 [Hibiscus sabdariffa]